MKKVLITGKNSYVGTAFERWLSQWPELYKVETIDVQEEHWRDISFKGNDVVFHVAGIVHNPKAPEELYYKVNRDLTVEIAHKAKKEGVRQFVFMSTMSVYGKKDIMGRENIITKDTPLIPNTPYGKSKLAAEKSITELQDDKFLVCVLRPPMIYGANCPGNYGKLREIVLRYHIIPSIENVRSLIHIDTLCKCIYQCICQDVRGTYCPQDIETVNTKEMMKRIAELNGQRGKESKFFGHCVLLASFFLPFLKKAFGNLTVDFEQSNIGYIYAEKKFEELMSVTEPW